MLSAIIPAVVSFIGSNLVGKAAKAGASAVIGAIGAPGLVAGTEMMTGTDLGLTLTGYILLGALQGAGNWVTTYFRVNKGAVDGVFPDAPNGLH